MEQEKKGYSRIVIERRKLTVQLTYMQILLSPNRLLYGRQQTGGQLRQLTSSDERFQRMCFFDAYPVDRRQTCPAELLQSYGLEICLRHGRQVRNLGLLPYK